MDGQPATESDNNPIVSDGGGGGAAADNAATESQSTVDNTQPVEDQHEEVAAIVAANELSAESAVDEAALASDIDHEVPVDWTEISPTGDGVVDSNSPTVSDEADDQSGDATFIPDETVANGELDGDASPDEAAPLTEQKLVHRLNEQQLASEIGQLKQEADQLMMEPEASALTGQQKSTNAAADGADTGISSSRQLLQTPTPDDREGFKFNNVADQSADPEADAVQVGIKLSRPGSSKVLSAAAEAQHVVNLSQSNGEVPRAVSPTGMVATTISKPPTATSYGLSRPTTVNSSGGRLQSGSSVLVSKPSTAASGNSAGRSGANSQQQTVVRFIDRQTVLSDIAQTYGRLQVMAKRLDKLETCLTDYFRKRNSDTSGGATDNANDTTQQQKSSATSAADTAGNSNNENNEKAAGELDLRYRSSLFSFRESLQRLDSMRDEHAKALVQYQATLEIKRQAAIEVYEEFIRHRHRVIVSAEYSKTGKPIPAKVIDQWEAMDQKRDAEISKAILENIKLRNRVRRSEIQLKEREELGDGLHLIDFEQLKIENQTFLEKIEERNEEVEKLRKKITVMVQILTHVKEKLEFMQSENSELQDDLSTIDQEISEHKDNLPAMKNRRDRLRKENQDIRSKSGLLGHRQLLKDLELKMDATVVSQEKLKQLKERYPQLDAQAIQLRRKLAKVVAELEAEKAAKRAA